MAVFQISKIQLRRGKKNEGMGLPQLSSAEMAWAVDTQELYIGNGSIDEGAPFVGNTKILTVNDNILDLVGNYQYKANDITIQTGLVKTNPVVRSLQDRLDDFVSSASFGIEPDTAEGQSSKIQQALITLFANPVTRDNPASKVPLYFLPGTYTIDTPIYIPSFSTIRGSGINKTIFNFTESGSFIFVGDAFDFTTTSYDDSYLTYLNQPRYCELSDFTIQSSSDMIPVTSGSTSIPVLSSQYFEQAILVKQLSNDNTTILDSFDTTIYRSAKYQIQLVQGTNYYSTTAVILFDGTDVNSVLYDVNTLGESLGTIEFTYTDPNINLVFTPSRADIEVNIIRSLMYNSPASSASSLPSSIGDQSFITTSNGILASALSTSVIDSFDKNLYTSGSYTLQLISDDSTEVDLVELKFINDGTNEPDITLFTSVPTIGDIQMVLNGTNVELTISNTLNQPVAVTFIKTLFATVPPLVQSSNSISSIIDNNVILKSTYVEVTSTTPVTLDSFRANEYSGGLYQIQLKSDLNVSTTIVYIATNSSTVSNSEYSVLQLGSTLGSFLVELEDGVVKLKISPTTGNQINVIFLKTLFNGNVTENINADSNGGSNSIISYDFTGLEINSLRDSKLENISIINNIADYDSYGIKGISLSSYSSMVKSQRNIFENIIIKKFNHAIYSDHDISNNHFNNLKIESCTYGISFGYNTNTLLIGQLEGPSSNIISQSIFENIARHGILVSHGSGNISRNNKFFNVGNDFSGVRYNKYSQIQFTSTGNTSSQDHFDRSSIDNSGNNFVPYIDGSVNYTNNETTLITLSSQSDTNIFSLPIKEDSGYVVEYILKDNDSTRKGKFNITVSSTIDVDSNYITQFIDDFDYIGNDDITDVEFNAISTKLGIQINYTNLFTLSTTTLTYTYTYSAIK